MVKDSVYTCMELYNKYKKIERELEEKIQRISGLGLNEFYLLYHLNDHPQNKMRLQEATQLVQLRQSAMSRLIMRLESFDEPIVRKSICNDDKRGIYVQLTEPGKEQYQLIIDNVQDLLKVFLEETSKL